MKKENCNNCECLTQKNWSKAYTYGNITNYYKHFWFWAIIRILITVALIIGAFKFGIYFNMNTELSASREVNTSHESETVDMHSKMHESSAHLHVASNLKNPKVSVEAFKDSMGGYNIKVTTTDFKWTPEKAGEGNEQVAGHAHVYVNGIKISRLYGQWMHIPADKFKPGKNTIDVTLNGNNHMAWYSTDDKYQIKGTANVIID